MTTQAALDLACIFFLWCSFACVAYLYMIESAEEGPKDGE